MTKKLKVCCSFPDEPNLEQGVLLPFFLSSAYLFLSIHLLNHLSICPSATSFLSTFLPSVGLAMCLCLSVCLSVCPSLLFYNDNAYMFKIASSTLTSWFTIIFTGHVSLSVCLSVCPSLLFYNDNAYMFKIASSTLTNWLTIISGT